MCVFAHIMCMCGWVGRCACVGVWVCASLHVCVGVGGWVWCVDVCVHGCVCVHVCVCVCTTVLLVYIYKQAQTQTLSQRLHYLFGINYKEVKAGSGFNSNLKKSCY